MPTNDFVAEFRYVFESSATPQLNRVHYTSLATTYNYPTQPPPHTLTHVFSPSPSSLAVLPVCRLTLLLRVRICVNCVQFCGCGRGYSAQRGRVGESSRYNATIFEAANRYVYNRNQCTAQVPVPYTVVQRTNMCSRKRMGYAPIRCAANGCFSSWQPPFMLTVHSYKLWCWRDVEPNHILSSYFKC